MTTSGASKNILNAIEMAESKGMAWLLLTSEKCKEDGGDNGLVIKWPFESTASVQLAHTFYIHMLCEVLENTFSIERGS